MHVQALWGRLLAYQHPAIRDEDLMMISESDVLITTTRILEPLDGRYVPAASWASNKAFHTLHCLNPSFRAWVYWAEPALYGGQTFAMSFTTLAKRDWQLLLLNR